MTGLMLFGGAFIWLFVALRLARWLSRMIKVRDSFRPLVSFALVLFIFLLPVADELAARPYFEALCHKAAALKIDAQRIRGKTVRLTVDPSNRLIAGTPIPILQSHFTYHDVVTGELMAEYDVLRARGGFLAQFAHLEGMHPLTGSFFCAPDREPPLAERYGFNVLE